MPRRTDSHVISDQALNRVMQICGECGWACEVVHKDYGEDIVVQTHYKGLMDHFRIWIQVKGTRDIERFHSRIHGYSVMVPVNQLLKWVRNKEVTVVVLWDVDRGFGLWAIPKDGTDEWKVYQATGRKTRLNFQDRSVFSAEQAFQISWRARIEHYSDLVDQAIKEDRICLEFAGAITDPKERSRVPLLAGDFLRILGILQDDCLDKEFIESYQEELKRLNGSCPHAEIEFAAACYLFASELDKISPGCSVPFSVLTACCYLIVFCAQHGNQAHLHISNADAWAP